MQPFVNHYATCIGGKAKHHNNHRDYCGVYDFLISLKSTIDQLANA
jgi:hypothetical protein